MGKFVFRLPDIGEGVTEAEIAAWHVAVGDHVDEDQPLVDVMTDKATVDMTSPVRGVVTALHGEAGDSRAVGSALVELEVEGHAEAEAPAPVAAPAPAKPVEAAKAETPAEPAPARRADGGKVLAAPAVRARARTLGVELAGLKGSGPGGQVTHADLDARMALIGGGRGPAAPTGPHLAAEYAGREGIKPVKIIGLRRKIAERMAESKRSIPHFAYVEEVDVTALEGLRTRYNEKATQRLTILPFLALAVIRTIPRFPRINSVYDDQEGVLYESGPIHLGVATQTDNGLMVPVVRNAQTLSVRGLSEAISAAAAGARDGTARREDLSGSTITVSSLGALGGIAATPVINHPEVAIIAPNKMREILARRPDGEIETRKVMNLSGSFDHRIIDGHDAASFVAQVKALLEAPDLMLLG